MFQTLPCTRRERLKLQLFLIDSIRTNNFNDERMMEKIGALWKEASRKLASHRDCIYGVYFDYESDYKGNYTLGVAIEGHGSPRLDIPDTEDYRVFKVDIKDEQGLYHAWKQIWALEEAGELRRAYTHDYEKYHPNGEIEIHIALK